jgi:hypothetical protein
MADPAEKQEPAPRPHVVSAELLLEDNTMRPMPLAEFEQLEREQNQDVLENVICTYSDGKRIRPYRFGSVGAVEFDGDRVVF